MTRHKATRPRPIAGLVACSLLAFAILVGFHALAIHLATEGGSYSALPITDFINDWTAAHLVREGRITVLFDIATYRDVMSQLLGGPAGVHSWSYPPDLLPFILPFAFVPYSVGLLLWSVLGMGAYYWAVKQAAPELPHGWVALLLLSPASMVNLTHGQTGLFCATFLIGGLYILPKRPLLAGVIFGLLTLKPHLGVLLAPALLISAQWRAIVAAGITTLTMVGSSIALWGVAPWGAYFTFTRAFQVGLLEEFNGFFLMPGIIPAVRTLGMPIDTAWILFAITALTALILVLVIVRREGISPRSVLAIGVGTFLTTPYGFNYDMTVICLALGLYWAAQAPQHPMKQWVLAMLWGAPVFMYLLGVLNLPLIPLLLLATLGIMFAESRRPLVIEYP